MSFKVGDKVRLVEGAFPYITKTEQGETGVVDGFVQRGIKVILPTGAVYGNEKDFYLANDLSSLEEPDIAALQSELDKYKRAVEQVRELLYLPPNSRHIYAAMQPYSSEPEQIAGSDAPDLWDVLQGEA